MIIPNLLTSVEGITPESAEMFLLLLSERREFSHQYKDGELSALVSSS